MTREEQIIDAAEEATYRRPPQYSELVYKTRKVMCNYEVGFIDGCVWADQHPNWISVEERLPETDDCGNSDYCLVADEEGDMYVAYWGKNEGFWFDDSDIAVLYVTHWMPIVPPKTKEQ